MRQAFSIAKATALEVLSEPLTLLILLSALTLAVLAPAFHYHQFGDATRMARDAGFSALFIGGGLLAVFGPIRAIRREIESGTLEMALAHPVSRRLFFLSKVTGAWVALVAFSVIVTGVTALMTEGARVGGLLAERTGDIARIFGPYLAGGLGVLLVPLVLSAVLNRFARFRFVFSALSGMFVLSLFGFVVTTVLDDGWILRLLPVAVPIVLLTTVLLSVASAFAVRFKANAAISCAGIVFAGTLPAVGNYYLADALSGAGTVPGLYVAAAALAALPAVGAFLLLGIRFMSERDVQWTM